ncbi:hypothetical protein PIIN_07462 [Serendipita indica DSM 11827]|uniref:Uncharacterized protein n=1 Tax=Serendipita indica (strain DSM 11827) TaxID=1109443 RepID=G4TQB6_SERID|nr:hypothetical protein PIIN_07462 [Serendipita indica DSM 11827]
MSALRILKEYFHRLEMDQKFRQRPCQYFDMIVGSGGGGVIAVLLGVLGMDIDKASLAFSRVCKVALLGDARSLTPEERTERLRGAIKQILGEIQVPEDSAFNSKVGLAGECKVAVLYQSAAHLGRCNLFRNYDSRHLALNATIMQVMLTAWATPTLFSSVRIEDEIGYEEVVSAASSCSNPIFEAIREAYASYGDQMTSCILSLGSGSQSTQNTDKGWKASITQSAKEAMRIAEDAQRRFGDSDIYFRLSVTPAIGDDQDVPGNTFGMIASSTSHYLSLTHQDKLIDECLRKSNRPGVIDLKSLAQVRGDATILRHGLPPLSPFFILRKEPTRRIFQGITQGRDRNQTIVVLSGMSGSGKTQLSIDFALKYSELFQHILFIEASSKESIENGIIGQARSIASSFQNINLDETMRLLENPNGKFGTGWLIIFDNADDENIGIQKYLPNCSHGSIIITTRNPSLGNLAPEAHVTLDIMSVEEATQALFLSAMSVNEERTMRHVATAQKIVQRLGYLPIAIVQAGGYIRKQKCFWEYIGRLETNRANLLRHYTIQRDRLKYKHGVYAAFDTTLSVLSSRALNLLSMLACMHFASIPRELFILAAKRGFDHQAFDLLPPSDGFQHSVSLLQETLGPSGDKQRCESDLDEVLDELFQYSLITYVPYYSTVNIRLHPLLHAWAGDRLTAEQRLMYRAATARLLGSCFVRSEFDLLDELSPHVSGLLPFMGDFHLNERAGFCLSLGRDRKFELQRKLWEDIYTEVQMVYGDEDVRTSTAALLLASAYGDEGDITKMEKMERSVIEIRSALYGPDSLEAIEALHNLARTLLYDKGELEEAKEILLRVLDVRRRALGPQHVDLCWTLHTLGDIYYRSKRYSEAVSTFLEASKMSTDLRGRDHHATVNSLWMLARSYAAQQDPVAQIIVREIHHAQERILGPDHPITLSSLRWLGEFSYRLADYEGAEKFYRQELALISEHTGLTDSFKSSKRRWKINPTHRELPIPSYGQAI